MSDSEGERFVAAKNERSTFVTERKKPKVDLAGLREQLSQMAKVLEKMTAGRDNTEKKSIEFAGRVPDMRFPTTKNEAYYPNWLTARKWRREESPIVYVYEMLAVGKKACFKEETIIMYIASGLHELWQKAKVTIGRAATVKDLLEEIRWVEGVEAVGATSSTKSVLPWNY
ncbi:hypothetical protein ZHAS_00014350 [Anopheles sinensis]|uniref:Uncharacterized protein n=1 Tax=Anopheles sinensis TaxID=74873 RepID=A0A084W8B2_ANOSI|nr:hypothetical protein ZHAS_00014350 [Anopheles sinensis]